MQEMALKVKLNYLLIKKLKGFQHWKKLKIYLGELSLKEISKLTGSNNKETTKKING